MKNIIFVFVILFLVFGCYQIIPLEEYNAPQIQWTIVDKYILDDYYYFTLKSTNNIISEFPVNEIIYNSYFIGDLYNQ